MKQPSLITASISFFFFVLFIGLLTIDMYRVDDKMNDDGDDGYYGKLQMQMLCKSFYMTHTMGQSYAIASASIRDIMDSSS